ncbi:HAD-IA family hydrolase [Thalassobaculum sp. OXR-137]|uniref:HAD family hydrolase n=1 Tax=Thalassobaculum sp. OXR-137 TaxID=3100173 RepID=UPI002AC9521B|nr:HAD-IA family hydrolase [Thalassobaculum sp. OXR-137]WPZ34734.1 HAD-IA family hydrolase [Thalassobaculum sp. OXR-137]
MPQPTALIFDCDGVLVDSEAIVMRIEQAAIAEAGLSYAPQDYATKFTGLSYDDFFATLDAEHRTRFGRPLDRSLYERIKDDSVAAMERELEAVPGIAELVEIVTVPTAVASSSFPDSLVMKLRKTGLYDRFAPHIYSTKLVPNGKPAPDIFLYAAEKLGVPAKDCVVLEDSVNGICAAVDAGMTAWGFTGAGHADPELAQRLTAAGAESVFDSHAAIALRLRE